MNKSLIDIYFNVLKQIDSECELLVEINIVRPIQTQYNHRQEVYSSEVNLDKAIKVLQG